MKKCIVVGAGLSGLTSAAYLSKAGFQVEIIEASKKLGGRAYSFKDIDSQTIIDNGQHILMGCYTDTLKFHKIINAYDNLIFQKKLRVNFLKENFNLFPLDCASLFYPLNLLIGLLNYKALSVKERFQILKFFSKIYFYADSELSKLTVFQWLTLENQNENIQKAFWDILAVGSLNTNTKLSSAKIFSDILKEIFFRGSKAATIILPKDGLTETYCNNAKLFIEKNMGKITTSETVNKFVFENYEIKKIITNKRIIEEFDFVISALPLYSLQKTVDDSSLYNNLELDYSSILSIHIWLNQNKLENTFYGLIDSQIHWIFNHGSHLTLVISDANEFIEKSKEEIIELISCELKKYVNIGREEIKAFKIIKEKRSTFIPGNKILKTRPTNKTEYSNFFLAGDWTDTGLPSTIESAAKSGRMAAELILNGS
jgi:squalene-associated FAD-dependent desaturase